MKQFLRYQISGLIYILWTVIFIYSNQADNIKDYLHLIANNEIFKNEPLYSFIAALPIGVIIHQFSVNIKNHILGKICKELNDYPKEKYIKTLAKNSEYGKYILDKISNLNSFYYVRFDNGFLAPFLALITSLMLGYSVNKIAVITAIIIGTLLLYYIPRLCEEIKEYNKLLTKAGLEKIETDLKKQTYLRVKIYR
jgi:hypothetical protein